ncbi:3-beta hydroxysteroid dehydrogenase/isomerase [Cryptococcus neoformans c45]|nr:3-beta hydroxysteroid dehydrogenase/isomerase [Cryptococcus neoformans var. grubii c45]
MKVFLTGASGYIGSHVTTLLLEAGHQLTAIARSDASAKKLEDQGVTVIRASLEDTQALTKAASDADTVIHLAYIHDFSDYGGRPAQIDFAAVRALATGLKGTNKPLVTTSGVPSPGIRICTELDVGKYGPRAEAENVLFEYTCQGVRTAVIRLPFTVHGDSDKGFIPHVIDQSRQKGVAAYVGEGDNHWPAVHVKDAAQLYKAVIESKTLEGGKILHAVQDEGIPFKQIAEVVGKKLGVETKSVADGDVGKYYSWLGMFVKMDFIGSSKLTREWLGWEPKEKGLLADLENSQTYFKE